MMHLYFAIRYHILTAKQSLSGIFIITLFVLFPDSLEYLIGEVLFRLRTNDAVLSVDNGMGNPPHIIFHCKERKFRTLHHVRGNMAAGYGKPVSSANRAWTIGSGRRYQNLYVNRLVDPGQSSHHIRTNIQLPFTYIKDIICKDLELIPSWNTIETDTGIPVA